MEETIYTFAFNPDWKLIGQLSQIDKFGGSWTTIEKREGQSLKQLKSIATVRSVGASTRIEGSRMTDDEVEVLIKNLQISTLEDRDQQEVVGYFETLDVISESFRDIPINENAIRGLHNLLMKHSEKDAWHKGKYKQHSNVVEATHTNGKKYVVFQTTDPGYATEDAMRKLIDWYNSDDESHPLVRAATFVYDFLSIHPFQDGNGRLSRLLATLLLLREGYSWIEYISFEHEIENRKADYYKVLIECQKNRPGENVYPWMNFFLDCMNRIQQLLMSKLEQKGTTAQMSVREKKIYVFIENRPGCRSGEIASALEIPLPTVKKILSEMVSRNSLMKHGIGAGTNYTIEQQPSIKKDLVFKLTNKQRQKEFLITHKNAFVELKQLILTPNFKWTKPEEWNSELIKEGLYIEVRCVSKSGNSTKQAYRVNSYRDPNLFQPVFTLNHPINIPLGLLETILPANDYPLKIAIDLLGSTKEIKFELMLVYDICL